MKKKLSRILAALLTLAMVFSLAACGGSDNPGGGNDNPGSNTDAPGGGDNPGGGNDNPGGGSQDGFLIGYNQLVTGDFALESLAANTKYGIEGLGNRSMCVIAGGAVEQTVTDVENMITAGIDGLVLWLPIDSLYLTVAEMCESAGVYWVLCDKVPTDPALLAQLNEYEYFCGGITPDNYSYGVAMAEYALSQGWSKAYVQAPGIGDATGTPRMAGFKDTFEAGGGQILGEAHTDDANEAVTQAEDLYLAYGDEVDCILATGAATFGSAALNILQKYNDHRVKILAGDLDQTILNSMATDDYVAMDTGDFWVCGTFASVMLINALNGNMLRDADGNAAIISNVPAFGVPAAYLDLFNKYIVGSPLFSNEELETMIGVSTSEMENIVASYSLESRFQSKYEQGIISADEMAAAGITVG